MLFVLTSFDAKFEGASFSALSLHSLSPSSLFAPQLLFCRTTRAIAGARRNLQQDRMEKAAKFESRKLPNVGPKNQ